MPTISHKNICRGSQAAYGAGLENQLCYAQQEFKSPPRRYVFLAIGESGRGKYLMKDHLLKNRINLEMSGKRIKFDKSLNI